MKRDSKGRFVPGVQAKNFDNLTGRTFGRLTVMGRAPDRIYGKQRKTTWDCHCTCGLNIRVVSQNLKSGNTVSCGCYNREQAKLRVGDKHQCWKGGRYIKPDGYVVLRLPNRNVLEHVHSMERHLRRRLYEHERVHHKNGIRDDNRIENLELWSISHPPGQRITDKTLWAIQWLRDYAPEYLL